MHISKMSRCAHHATRHRAHLHWNVSSKNNTEVICTHLFRYKCSSHHHGGTAPGGSGILVCTQELHAVEEHILAAWRMLAVLEHEETLCHAAGISGGREIEGNNTTECQTNWM